MIQLLMTTMSEPKVINSDTGNRTPVSRVTGGDTSHYTMSDKPNRPAGAKFLNSYCPTILFDMHYKVRAQKRENNTRDSNVVPHRSTNRARQCLTSLSRREAVLSLWFGRSHFQHIYTWLQSFALKKTRFWLINSFIPLKTASYKDSNPFSLVWGFQSLHLVSTPRLLQGIPPAQPFNTILHMFCYQNIYLRAILTSEPSSEVSPKLL